MDTHGPCRAAASAAAATPSAPNALGWRTRERRSSRPGPGSIGRDGPTRSMIVTIACGRPRRSSTATCGETASRWARRTRGIARRPPRPCASPRPILTTHRACCPSPKPRARASRRARTARPMRERPSGNGGPRRSSTGRPRRTRLGGCAARRAGGSGRRTSRCAGSRRGMRSCTPEATSRSRGASTAFASPRPRPSPARWGAGRRCSTRASTRSPSRRGGARAAVGRGARRRARAWTRPP